MRDRTRGEGEIEMPTVTRSKIFVGYTSEPLKLERFKSIDVPTHASHGDKYRAVIGPFRTARGAEFMRVFGVGNPHCRCVADAERLAKLYPNATSVPYRPMELDAKVSK